MRINTNREVEIFDQAYRLGFRAGQLDWRAYIIAENYYIQASADLLEALEFIIAQPGLYWHMDKRRREKARAAIAKAKGET